MSLLDPTIDHAKLRRENEPMLADVLYEQTLGNRERGTDAPSCAIDFDLIQRVMQNEVERDVRRIEKWVQRLMAGRRAKQRNSSTTGKNLTPVSAVDSITDTSK